MCDEKAYAIPGASSDRVGSPCTMKSGKGQPDLKPATDSLTITGSQGVVSATVSDAKAGTAKNAKVATAVWHTRSSISCFRHSAGDAERDL